MDLHGTAQSNAKVVRESREEEEEEKKKKKKQASMEREVSEEYELNEIDAGTLHGSVGSRLSLFARELKWRRSSSRHIGSSAALRLPQSCCYGNFVIHPNGR
jgi:hypothetical protein